MFWVKGSEKRSVDKDLRVKTNTQDIRFLKVRLDRSLSLTFLTKSTYGSRGSWTLT